MLRTLWLHNERLHLEDIFLLSSNTINLDVAVSRAVTRPKLSFTYAVTNYISKDRFSASQSVSLSGGHFVHTLSLPKPIKCMSLVHGLCRVQNVLSPALHKIIFLKILRQSLTSQGLLLELSLSQICAISDCPGYTFFLFGH